MMDSPVEPSTVPKGTAKGGQGMAHLLSIAFFLALLVGLGMLLENMLRGNGSAIRAALVGTWNADPSGETALSCVGICLRASFPSVGQEPIGDDLSRLVLQLSPVASPGR
jgi:hypothetical protein